MEELSEPSALVDEELEQITRDGWTVERDDFWTHVRPAVSADRMQGWKLHVSATIVSAPDILRACFPLLVESGTPFKFASTIQILDDLNGFRAPRGSSGKFITVYPPGDAEFRHLAERLHTATEGMAGPAILSDARYRKESLVHYRYGAFTGLRVLSNDGRYRNCVLSPEGFPVEDRRTAVFDPPAWAVMPFETPPRPAGGAAAVLLDGRFEVSAAIRHANKGGVYRARDRLTGTKVIIKEARPFVATNRRGRHVGDLLRHEANVLRRLEPFRLAPRVIAEFDQGGHFYLAEEFIPGETIMRRANLAFDAGTTWPPPEAVPGLIIGLAQIVRAAHAAGVVIRDLTPANVLVLPDGGLRLIDFELAAVMTVPGATAVTGGTPGFSAPEQLTGAIPDVTADLFSLGAVAFYLVTQINPALAGDRPAGWELEDRVAQLLGPPHVPQRPAAATYQVITGLMRTDPASRIPLRDVLAPASAAGPTSEPAAGETALGAHDGTDICEEERWRTLIAGILGHLAANLPADPESRPWPETAFGAEAEICTVQHGLAGALAVLTRLTGHDEVGQHVPGLLDAVLPRITRHLSRAGHRLPGLYFGFAGTAWALFDAGRALGRQELSARALDLATGLPTSWPNPDMTHGISGLGTCLVHLWRQTGDSRLLERAAACAERVLAAADTREGSIGWTIPTSFDSELAGYRSHGFAHGTAGIGAFLLAAGQETGDPKLLSAARRCGESLLGAATYIQDAAYWPDQPGSGKLMVFWCNGSSGVGTFLSRLYAHERDPRYRDAAAAAGRAVLRSRWQSGTTYCHGLAGNGDFLLDLAAATGTGEHGAKALADLLWARRLDRAGRPVLADETGVNITGGYGTGLFGHLSFLLRLCYGGTRLFHPGPLGEGEAR